MSVLKKGLGFHLYDMGSDQLNLLWAARFLDVLATCHSSTERMTCLFSKMASTLMKLSACSPESNKLWLSLTSWRDFQ